MPTAFEVDNGHPCELDFDAMIVPKHCSRKSWSSAISQLSDWTSACQESSSDVLDGARTFFVTDFVACNDDTTILSTSRSMHFQDLGFYVDSVADQGGRFQIDLVVQ